MTFKISKSDRNEIDAKIKAMNDARSEIERTVSNFNAIMAEHFEPIKDAVETWNTLRGDLGELISPLVDDFRSDIDERSEKWLESERGQAVIEWVDRVESFVNDIDELDVDAPDDFEVEVPEIDMNDLEDSPGENG
jgi:hypothetical protein